MGKLKVFGVFMLILAVLLFLAVAGFFIVPLLFIAGAGIIAWISAQEYVDHKREQATIVDPQSSEDLARELMECLKRTT